LGLELPVKYICRSFGSTVGMVGGPRLGFLRKSRVEGGEKAVRVKEKGTRKELRDNLDS